MAKDPVCNMIVDEKTAKLKSDYNDKTYYFCAPSCKSAFDKTLEKFAKGAGTQGGHSCSCGGH